MRHSQVPLTHFPFPEHTEKVFELYGHAVGGDGAVTFSDEGPGSLGGARTLDALPADVGDVVLEVHVTVALLVHATAEPAWRIAHLCVGSRVRRGGARGVAGARTDVAAAAPPVQMTFAGPRDTFSVPTALSEANFARNGADERQREDNWQPHRVTVIC